MRKIIKVYSNNVVSARQGELEIIAIGAGVGFHKHPGDPVDESKVEKIYTFETKQQKQLHQLMEGVPILYFRISEAIAAKAMEKLKIRLSSQILISLSDHICYAVERKKKGISIPNLMLNEIQALYRQEFKIGLWALKLIEVNTGVVLDQNEAGYIAMHIVNATIGGSAEYSQISRILRFIKDIQRIVEDTYGIEMDEKNLNHARFVTHLKFLGQHIFSNTKNDPKDKLNELYVFFSKRDDRINACIEAIAEMVREKYQYELQENEKVYLMIHISKMVE